MIHSRLTRSPLHVLCATAASTAAAVSVKRLSSGEREQSRVASAVNVATTAARTEDETEQVDSFIVMQRGKGTPGTVRTDATDHSPMPSGGHARRKSERTSTLLVRSPPHMTPQGLVPFADALHGYQRLILHGYQRPQSSSTLITVLFASCVSQCILRPPSA
jgi:hypothetical protein